MGAFVPQLLIDRKSPTEARKLRADMDKLYRLYLADEVSMDGFGRENKPREARLKALETEIPRLQGEVDFLKIQYLSRDEVLADARDLYDRWPSLNFDEKRAIVEAIVQSVTIGKDEVEIDLAYFPARSEVAAERQRNFRRSSPRL